MTDSLEVSLVKSVRSCRDCRFFWPKGQPQPYGPYPVYDFKENYPSSNEIPPPPGVRTSVPWVAGITRKESFPKPEVMDGCRKAPIMTIGINPNLTAFGLYPTGASWMYPDFTGDTVDNDQWKKYAYYYRYRTVMQECMGQDLLRDSLLSEGQVKAEKAGYIDRPYRDGIERKIKLWIKYDDGTEEEKELRWNAGEPRYVVLVDEYDSFDAGTVIAARLNVTAGKNIQVFQEEVGYYEQFVPVLGMFAHYLKDKGHPGVNLEMGEDVCQLDMVACASPHWSPGYLGGDKSKTSIIDNCVRKNAWAPKQLAQTRPAVLVLVGEASYEMFSNAFGRYIEPPIPGDPADGPFTLLKETLEKTYYINYSGNIDGQEYKFKTRLAVSPHFSYNSNFYIQVRFSPRDWKYFTSQYQPAYQYLEGKKKEGVEIVNSEYEGGYYAVQFTENAEQMLDSFKKGFPTAWENMEPRMYNPHLMLAEVLGQEYRAGNIAYIDGQDGHNGFLARTSGQCDFCVNDHWKFPLGCPYGKVSP